MDSRNLKLENGFIVYDADLFSQADLQPGEALFAPPWWERQGKVKAHSKGRGNTLIVETPFGGAVLRQYLRGGWPAKFSASRYLFTGFRHSRPVREFRILEQLAKSGLPSPRPIAAMCRREGILCTGAILLREIENVRTLADGIPSLEEKHWRAVGACVRRFHDHGVVHADLNARNILINEVGKVFLVDFDRARIGRTSGRLALGSLRRLRRSLEKFWEPGFGDLDKRAWTHFRKGYGSSLPRA